MAFVRQDLDSILAARSGHFRLESRHHGDLWFDLEVLCLRPRRLQTLVEELATRLSSYSVDAVCGPLVEGAYVGLLVARELDSAFYYTQRFDRPESETLFPVEYRVPGILRGSIRGKRVAIVNDAINAGSAVQGTLHDLAQCGANTVAVGTLLVLGNSAFDLAADRNVALETLEHLPNVIWTPAECPLCAAGVPLEDVTDFSG